MKRIALLPSAALAACLGCEGSNVSLHYHEDRPRPIVHRTTVVEPAPIIVHEPAPVIVHEHRPVVVERRSVVVPHGHICSHHCDHYHDGLDFVVVSGGHRHGPGCGHELHSGRWVVVGKSRGHHAPPRPTRKRVFRRD